MTGRLKIYLNKILYKIIILCGNMKLFQGKIMLDGNILLYSCFNDYTDHIAIHVESTECIYFRNFSVLPDIIFTTINSNGIMTDNGIASDNYIVPNNNANVSNITSKNINLNVNNNIILNKNTNMITQHITKNQHNINDPYMQNQCTVENKCIQRTPCITSSKSRTNLMGCDWYLLLRSKSGYKSEIPDIKVKHASLVEIKFNKAIQIIQETQADLFNMFTTINFNICLLAENIAIFSKDDTFVFVDFKQNVSFYVYGDVYYNYNSTIGSTYHFYI